MQNTQYITHKLTDISVRAALIGIRLSDLCASAGVHYSTVQRWMTGTSPRLRTFDNIITRLTLRLEERERQVLADLLLRHGKREAAE
jgi:predicted transcriptional regulator